MFVSGANKSRRKIPPDINFLFMVKFHFLSHNFRIRSSKFSSVLVVPFLRTDENRLQKENADFFFSSVVCLYIFFLFYYNQSIIKVFPFLNMVHFFYILKLFIVSKIIKNNKKKCAIISGEQ